MRPVLRVIHLMNFESKAISVRRVYTNHIGEQYHVAKYMAKQRSQKFAL